MSVSVWGQRIPFFNCGWEEAVSNYVCRVSNLQELTVMFICKFMTLLCIQYMYVICHFMGWPRLNKSCLVDVLGHTLVVSNGTSLQMACSMNKEVTHM